MAVSAFDRGEEIVGDVLMHDQPAAGIAAFAGIEEAAEHGGVGGGLEVGIGKDDLAFLPPSSIDTFFSDCAAAAMVILPTRVEPVNDTISTQRMADHRRADIRAEAGDDVDDAGRHAGFQQDLAEHEASRPRSSRSA